MGSPLGVLFANFYLGTIEEKVINDTNKPIIYCRYIDDIFILSKNEQEILDIKNILMLNSVLNFTVEDTNNNILNYLDIKIEMTDDEPAFKTSVYIKETNSNSCLKGYSECTDRYKKKCKPCFKSLQRLEIDRYGIKESETSPC